MLSVPCTAAPAPATPAAQQTRSTSAAAASYVHTASISRGSDEDTQRDEDDRTKKRHNRFIAYQALFYSSAFLNTIVPTFIGGVVQLILESADRSA